MTPSIQPSTKKSFWSKPEGTVGYIFWGIAIAAIIWFWGNVVGFLLSAALDTLHLIIVAGVIAILLWILLSKRVHFLGRALARRITSLFIAIDPLSIRKEYKATTEKKKAELDEAVGEIRGLRGKLKRSLDDNQKQYAQSMSLLQGANTIATKLGIDAERKHQAERVIALESRRSDGLKQAIDRQQSHSQDYDKTIYILGRYGEMCDDYIAELNTAIQLQEQEDQESRSFLKGMKAAGGILKGLGMERDMDDEAKQLLEDQYTQRMGQVEELLDLTKGMVAKDDFSNQSALDQIQAKLDAWQNQGLKISAPEPTLQIETKEKEHAS